MCVRVCEKPSDNVILDWTSRLRAYEHSPEEGQWRLCVTGQRASVLGQEAAAAAGPLAAGLNAGGDLTVSLEADREPEEGWGGGDRHGIISGHPSIFGRRDTLT